MCAHQEEYERHACDCGGQGQCEHHDDARMEQSAARRCQHAQRAGCCGGGTLWDRNRVLWRRLQTREERIARLERYLTELRAEAQAAEERIAELRAK